MASKSTGPKMPRGSKLTIGFGLVNVEVRYATLVPSSTGRASATTCCRTHQAPMVPSSSGATCSVGGEFVTGDERVMMYEVADGRYVAVDKEGLAIAATKRLEVTASVEAETLDPLFYERTFVVWPEPGSEAAYDLIAAYCRKHDKMLVGTTVLRDATKMVALRWSSHTETLLAHQCVHDARIRWDDVATVAGTLAARPEPSAEMMAQAEMLVGTLADEFEIDGVVDEYAAALDEAIDRAAQGLPPEIRADEPEAIPVGDLMTALKASVEAVKPKTKAKTKAQTKAKTPAKTEAGDGS